MLTYDDTPEIRQLADKYNLQFRTIPMKTTLHFEKTKSLFRTTSHGGQIATSAKMGFTKMGADGNCVSTFVFQFCFISGRTLLI